MSRKTQWCQSSLIKDKSEEQRRIDNMSHTQLYFYIKWIKSPSDVDQGLPLL